MEGEESRLEQAERQQACSSFGWWSRLHFETFFLPSSCRCPCLQRGEAWEKSQITAGPTFSPELWRKDCFEPASRVSANNLHLLKIVRCKGPVRKFAVQDEKKRGENHARKTTTPHEILLSLAAAAGADTNKTTTINHANIFICILGVYLCNSGSIGMLWLSRHYFSSAALFRVLEHRLIVLNYIFSYNNKPMKLKLSHA